MHRRIAVLALAGLAATTVAPAAGAATRRSCKLIEDRTGDTRYDVDAHDLTGGDIATGKTNLVAVVRVKSLADDPRATVYGATYRFNFTIGTSRYLFELRRALGSADAAKLVEGNTTIATPTVKIDTQNNQILFTVKRTLFKGLKKRNAKITELNLDSGTGTAAIINTDDAKPKDGTAYVDRTPSCLSAS